MDKWYNWAVVGMTLVWVLGQLAWDEIAWRRKQRRETEQWLEKMVRDGHRDRLLEDCRRLVSKS